MSYKKICIIGAGNISNTRHIPSLEKIKECKICGIISDERKKIDRTYLRHKYLRDKPFLLIDTDKDIVEQLKQCKWFEEIDAVVIGTPPKQHFPMVRACLLLNKHVLVEKPMMMSVNECDEVMEIAHRNKRILQVMHSFQFSKGMEEMYSRYKSGEFGELKSILELQLTNRDRRLPVWYNELPLGLFYDEAAHFFYGARRFGGKLKVLNAHAQYNAQNDNTPRFLEAQLKSGNIPVQMYMKFNSPICEWGMILICDKKIAVYDYFKDIVVVLKNDNMHLAKDVLRTSFMFSFLFWKGFIKNGFKMLSHNLLYGHDRCMKKYIEAIDAGETCFELSAELGKEVVTAMNEVVRYVKEK